MLDKVLTRLVKNQYELEDSLRRANAHGLDATSQMCGRLTWVYTDEAKAVEAVVRGGDYGSR